jgi:hypothetical protein
METAICDECGETGHSANKCPIRPCNACGAVDQSFAPPYFMKVNGMPYYRMLFVNNASEPLANPLHMYHYDSDYQLRDNP